MKGIWHQIRERGKTVPDNNFTKENLIEFLEDLQKSYVEGRKRKLKIQKENNKHLVERSKELGKEIPFEVSVMTDPYFNPSLLVSGEFMKKYEEWF